MLSAGLTKIFLDSLLKERQSLSPLKLYGALPHSLWQAADAFEPLNLEFLQSDPPVSVNPQNFINGYYKNKINALEAQNPKAALALRSATAAEGLKQFWHMSITNQYGSCGSMLDQIISVLNPPGQLPLHFLDKLPPSRYITFINQAIAEIWFTCPKRKSLIKNAVQTIIHHYLKPLEYHQDLMEEVETLLPEEQRHLVTTHNNPANMIQVLQQKGLPLTSQNPPETSAV